MWCARRWGEEDDFIVYPDPDTAILEKLTRYRTRTELWNDLPVELGYKRKREAIPFVR